jgi:hypothetical protein
MQHRATLLKLLAISGFTILFAACKKSSGHTAQTPQHVSIAGQNNGFATVWTDGVAAPLSTVFSDAFVIKYYNGHLYVGGYQLALNGQIQSGYWVDGIFTQLYADPTITANIRDLTVAGSDVYVTGWIDSSFYSIPFYWKNGQRITLTGGPTSYYPVVRTSGIAVSNGDVYVSGTVNTNSTGHSFAAYWKDGVLIPLGDSVNDNSFATGIALSGSNVFVCGYGDAPSNSFATLWQNGMATTLSVDQTEITQTGGLAVSGADVYVTGTVTYGNQPYTSAIYWKNGSPVFLTNGMSNAVANGIFADNVDVFVAGSVVNPTGVTTASYWKDNNSVALPDSTTTSVARSVCEY